MFSARKNEVICETTIEHVDEFLVASFRFFFTHVVHKVDRFEADCVKEPFST